VESSKALPEGEKGKERTPEKADNSGGGKHLLRGSSGLVLCRERGVSREKNSPTKKKDRKYPLKKLKGGRGKAGLYGSYCERKKTSQKKTPKNTSHRLATQIEGNGGLRVQARGKRQGRKDLNQRKKKPTLRRPQIGKKGFEF